MHGPRVCVHRNLGEGVELPWIVSTMDDGGPRNAGRRSIGDCRALLLSNVEFSGPLRCPKITGWARGQLVWSLDFRARSHPQVTGAERAEAMAMDAGAGLADAPDEGWLSLRWRRDVGFVVGAEERPVERVAWMLVRDQLSAAVLR